MLQQRSLALVVQRGSGWKRMHGVLDSQASRLPLRQSCCTHAVLRLAWPLPAGPLAVVHTTSSQGHTFAALLPSHFGLAAPSAAAEHSSRLKRPREGPCPEPSAFRQKLSHGSSHSLPVVRSAHQELGWPRSLSVPRQGWQAAAAPSQQLRPQSQGPRGVATSHSSSCAPTGSVDWLSMTPELPSPSPGQSHATDLQARQACEGLMPQSNAAWPGPSESMLSGSEAPQAPADQPSDWAAAAALQQPGRSATRHPSLPPPVPLWQPRPAQQQGSGSAAERPPQPKVLQIAGLLERAQCSIHPCHLQGRIENCLMAAATEANAASYTY